MTEQKQLVDLILEVLSEIGATENHPQHRSVFNPIVEAPWKKLGHIIAPNSDFGQEVSAGLHRHSSDGSRTQQKERNTQTYLECTAKATGPSETTRRDN